jgi:hypothetical protein
LKLLFVCDTEGLPSSEVTNKLQFHRVYTVSIALKAPICSTQIIDFPQLQTYSFSSL